MVGITALAACSSLPLKRAAKSQQAMTLADLKAREISVEKQTLEAVSSAQVLSSYEQVVALFSTREERATAWRRMADLTMSATEEAIDLSLQEDPQAEMEDSFEPEQEYVKAIAMYLAIIAESGPDEDLSEEYYMLAKVYDLAGQPEQALVALDKLVAKYPAAEFYQEAQFRRGEYLFQTNRYTEATAAYGALIAQDEKQPDEARSDFYDYGLYKHGWSLYKLGDYDLALGDFSKLLERYWPENEDIPYVPDPESNQLADSNDQALNKEANTETDAEEPAPATTPTPFDEQDFLASLGTGKRLLLTDTLRVMAMSFSNLEGPASAASFFANQGHEPYEYRVFEALAELYIKQERYQDAADAYTTFSTSQPESPQAPLLAAKVIDTYRDAGFGSKVVIEKENYVRKYGLYGPYWLTANQENRAYYSPILKKHLFDLAQYEHALAQNTGKPADYQRAALWYREYLETFPADSRSPLMHRLLAESLFASRNYAEAVTSFEAAAYDFPLQEDSEKAGYFALLSYQEQINSLAKDSTRQQDWIRRRSVSSLKFAATFPTSEHVPQVLDSAIEDQLLLGDIAAAVTTAQLIINTQSPLPEGLRVKAWQTYANAKYDQQHWVAAEQAMAKVLTLAELDPSQQDLYTERMATSIYKQAEAMEAKGELATAADQYLRAAIAAPGTAVAAKAEYDSANLSLMLEDYERAVTVLESFRQNYPNHELVATLPAKLSLAYQKTGRMAQAATELVAVAELSEDSDPDLARSALYQAAEIKRDTGEPVAAIALFKDYVWTFEQPVGPRMEAQYQLVQLYEQTGDRKKRAFWLNKLSETHKKAGSQQTDRTLYLAAFGAFHHAEALYDDFQAIRLRQPLKQSLRRKKTSLQQASKAYTQTVNYGVAEFTTAANYKLGELYRNFAASIMASERPSGLDEFALEEYELLLEDQAIPFEDKAIAILKTNTERTKQKIWDQWVEKSYQSLGKLSPARFNKIELKESYVGDLY